MLSKNYQAKYVTLGIKDLKKLLSKIKKDVKYTVDENQLSLANQKIEAIANILNFLKANANSFNCKVTLNSIILEKDQQTITINKNIFNEDDFNRFVLNMKIYTRFTNQQSTAELTETD